MLQIQNHDLIPSQPTTSTQVRKKIQHYSFCLGDKIGKGFSSIVYKGKNDITNEIVAIKVIQLRSLRDNITKNLLRTELECIKKISHPNLLKYIDSYQTINNCYIVTQFCDGGDLQKQLKFKGKLTQQQFNEFFIQFYQGYQNFFNSGYIHRDLKPANIFIKGGGQIKIADFGMVKKTVENPRDSYNVGTPVYMPPQSIFSNIYTQKSDVWSIGVMCYQLTHGTLPWKGATEHQLKQSIQNDRVNFDGNLVSTEFVKFVSLCLEKNPNNRISVAQMVGHPWMIKIGQMGNNMASLKPNRYFASEGCPKVNIKHNSSMTNQSPLLSIQKRDNTSITPVRNTTTPKPLTTPNNLLAVPSFQLTNKQSQNINTSNRFMAAKTERPTMDSEVCSKRKNPHLQTKPKNSHNFIEYLKSKKSTLDYLVSILNYLRYLYKITIVIEQSKNTILKDPIKNLIIQVLIRQLIKSFTLLQNMTKTQSNTFGFNDWDQFIKGKKWATFKGVVEQYSHKYNKLFDKLNDAQQHPNQQKQKRLSTQLAPLIHQLYKIANTHYQSIPPSQQTHPMYEFLEILDYLITIHNLEEMIHTQGWLPFADNSPINTIVQCKCMVDRNNYISIWEKLGNKCQLIAGSTLPFFE